MDGDLQEIIDRRNSLLSDFQFSKRQLEEEQLHMGESEQRLADCQQAQLIIQEVSQTVQAKAHKRIATLVTRCIQAIFGESYAFILHFERRAGKTVAKMAFENNGHEVSPTLASEGGLVDVAAFALRLSRLMLIQPPARRVLILDEPFRFVNGSEYQKSVAQLLETLAEELGVQIIMATDDEWLQIGNVIEL